MADRSDGAARFTTAGRNVFIVSLIGLFTYMLALGTTQGSILMSISHDHAQGC